MHKATTPAAAALLLLAGRAALAAPYLEASTETGWFEEYADDSAFEEFGPVLASSAVAYEPVFGVVQGQATANAYADYGLLRADAIVSDSSGDHDDARSGDATALAAFFDPITVTNPADPADTGLAQITISIRVDGYLAEDPAFPGSASEDASHARSTLTINAAGGPDQITTWTVDDPLLGPVLVDDAASATFTINFGTEFDLSVSLETAVVTSGAALFGNTATVESVLVTRDGVPINAQVAGSSGVVYPIPAAPTAALAALAAAVCPGRRR